MSNIQSIRPDGILVPEGVVTEADKKEQRRQLIGQMLFDLSERGHDEYCMVINYKDGQVIINYSDPDIHKAAQAIWDATQALVAKENG